MALDFEKAFSKITPGEASAANEPEKKFDRKCICDWSNQDGMGFIPNTICPVHGEQTKKMLKQSVSYGGKKGRGLNIDTKKLKSWIIAGVIALFTAIVVWRIILKFV